ncbi:MAG: aminomethyltransferase family protein [Planctomycetaceae bacterium]|nr:aminomethyltransferase family protein [Planctomycetaceae bacterium]
MTDSLTQDISASSRKSWATGPANYGDARAEELAARNEAALFDVTGRTHLTLTGRDRARFLHGFCTNDVKRLTAGEGCEAFVTNLKGRILEHILIAVAAEAIEVSGTAGFEEPLYAHLDRYLITDDVQIARRSDELAELFVSGPKAASLVNAVADGSGSIPPYAHHNVSIAGVPCAVQRLDLLGTMGYLVTVPRGDMESMQRALTQAGARPAGADVFDALRIESGLPLYGVDLSEDNLAQEAMRTEQCISFKKGCYLGQEPIARLDALGHVNRQLTAMRFATDALPAAGTALLTADGKDAGKISSAARVPSTGQIIAMGMVRSAFAKPGSELFIEVAGNRVRGEVATPR